jgi:hypothetical protein
MSMLDSSWIPRAWDYAGGQSNLPVYMTYQYYNCGSPPCGGLTSQAATFISQNQTDGTIPVFVSWMITSAGNPVGGNLSNASFMNGFYTQWKTLFQTMGGYSMTIIAHIEPDLHDYAAVAGNFNAANVYTAHKRPGICVKE